ncbi:MAG: sulfur carrier protein ThiS [Leptospirillum sp.]|jgi:thiamine biosynthesis protein ThiS|nr:sulfur carrier protein ThiS [Nitrospiraceae bacterium]
MSDGAHVYVNGESCPFSPGTKISGLLKELGLSDRQVVVELNLSILQKEDWDKTEVNEGDRIEIIGFVGGGSSCMNLIEGEPSVYIDHQLVINNSGHPERD